MNIPIQVTDEQSGFLRANLDNYGVKALIAILKNAAAKHAECLVHIPVNKSRALWTLRGRAKALDDLCVAVRGAMENEGSNPGIPDNPTPGQTIIQNTD
jgi:hypothetical protein